MKWTMWEWLCMGLVSVVLTAALFMIICFLCTGCQTYEEKEYYENGQIKKEIKRDGIPNWSDNKELNISGAKAL